MPDPKKPQPAPTGGNYEPLLEDRGLPPVKQTLPMPKVKPPKKD